MFRLVLALIIIVSGIKASNGEPLIEQEFKPIFTGKQEIEPNPQAQEKTIDLKSVNSKIKNITIKNEFFESLKIILQSNIESDKVIYLNAYETVKDVSINREASYKIKIYNLYDEYLGFLYNVDLNKQNKIQISPFLIIAEKNPNEKSPSKTHQIPNSVAKPLPQPKEISLSEAPEQVEIIDSPIKKIKVANISDSDVIISINRPDILKENFEWTIKNDTYQPQYLNFNNQAIEVDSKTIVSIKFLDTNKEKKVTCSEIEVDEKNDYSLLVE